MKAVGTLIEGLRRGEDVPGHLHNPYIAEAADLRGILFTTEELKADGISLFADKDSKVIIEVGSYFGKNLIEMAKNNPQTNFLGLELTYKRAVRCARKIKKDNLPNARIGICDAREFFTLIADASIAGVCVFFPDPWPKKRNAKNRLLRSEFIKILEQKLNNNGFVWLKTDQEFYFLEAQSNFKSNNWQVSELDSIPEELGDFPYITAFEDLFMKKGLSPCRQVYRKSFEA